MPGRTAPSEKPYPGSDGIITSNTKFWLGQGFVNMGIIFWNSTTDPGHPCNMSKGKTFKFLLFGKFVGFTW